MPAEGRGNACWHSAAMAFFSFRQPRNGTMPRRQYIARSLASETRSVFLRQRSLRLSASSAAGAEIGRDKGRAMQGRPMAGLPRFWTAMHAREPCGGGAGGLLCGAPTPWLLPALPFWAASALLAEPLKRRRHPSSVDPIQRRDRPGSRSQPGTTEEPGAACVVHGVSFARSEGVWCGGRRSTM